MWGEASPGRGLLRNGQTLAEVEGGPMHGAPCRRTHATRTRRNVGPVHTAARLPPVAGGCPLPKNPRR